MHDGGEGVNRLLACIDASPYALSVCDHAAWAAARLGASIELLHVIQRPNRVAAQRDLGGIAGFDASGELLSELARIDDEQRRLAEEQGQVLTAAAARRLQAGGVENVEITQRLGGIVETVIEREEGADLVVIGKRGASADFARGHLGSKVERVVRQSVKPVLVASREFRPIRRALIAFDGGPSARKAVAFAATSPLLEGVELHIVTAGADDQRHRDPLRWAREVLADRVKRAEIIGGDPDAAIVADAGQCGADLILMGAYGHSPLRNLFVGSTTTAVMRGVQLPVLLFR